MITRCQRCNRPLKQRPVKDHFAGRDYAVTVTGIPAAVCHSCGFQAVEADTLDEIEMFVRPLVAGGLGMRVLADAQVTIDLGNPLYAGITDLAGRPLPDEPMIEHPIERQFGRSFSSEMETTGLAAGAERAA